MDACKKIKFYTPLQTAAQIAGILATGAVMLAMIVMC